MPQKIVFVPELGNVELIKRRGSKNIRLRVSNKGAIRVSLPYWTPYSAGISFAKSKSDWLATQLSIHAEAQLRDGDKIGKYHTLRIEVGYHKTASFRLKDTEVIVHLPNPVARSAAEQKIKQAAEAALKQEAEKLLPQRLSLLAKQHGFAYKNVRVRKLTSRWGSCSHDKTITLSIFLMQLPWQLIDYVLLHELMHTRHMHHGRDFWQDFDRLMPGVKQLRKQVNAYKSMVRPAEAD